MGTRCNIRITDERDELWFYRHYDGYPDMIIPDLAPLMEALQNGHVRDNVGQFSGWLIVIGNKDMWSNRSLPTGRMREGGYSAWKCGNYEPTTGRHGDIDFLYHIDLVQKTMTVYNGWTGEEEDLAKFFPHEVIECYPYISYLDFVTNENSYGYEGCNWL